MSLRHLSDRADVCGSRAAAAADHVQPAVPREALQHRGQRIGRLAVQAVFVGQARVGVARHVRSHRLVDRSDMVRHVFRTRRAVESDAEQPRMLQRHRQGFGALPGQHRPRGLDGARDDHRDSQAVPAQSLPDADERCLDVAGILAGLEDEQVRIVGQRESLVSVGRDKFGECHPARDGNRLGRGSHGTRDEARLATCGASIGHFPSQAAGLCIDASNVVLKPVLGKHDIQSAECVRFDDVRAGLAIVPVDLAHNVRPGEHEVLVAAIQGGAAKVLGSEPRVLKPSAHRPVKHEDALCQAFVEQAYAIEAGLHCTGAKATGGFAPSSIMREVRRARAIGGGQERASRFGILARL